MPQPYNTLDLETQIRDSYDRLRVRSIVYLLRNSATDYPDHELPDPESADKIYMARVMGLDQTRYIGGVSLVDLPGLNPQSNPESVGPVYVVSPREVFRTSEMKTVQQNQTTLPISRPAKFYKNLESKSGKFQATLAKAMAREVIKSFEYDPRVNGRLVSKR